MMNYTKKQSNQKLLPKASFCPVREPIRPDCHIERSSAIVRVATPQKPRIRVPRRANINIVRIPACELDGPCQSRASDHIIVPQVTKISHKHNSSLGH